MAMVMKVTRNADGGGTCTEHVVAEPHDAWASAVVPFKPAGGANAGPIGALMATDAGGAASVRKQTARLMRVGSDQLLLAHLRAKLDVARTEAAASLAAVAKHDDEVGDTEGDWEDEEEEGEDEEPVAAPPKRARPAKPAGRKKVKKPSARIFAYVPPKKLAGSKTRAPRRVSIFALSPAEFIARYPGSLGAVNHHRFGV